MHFRSFEFNHGQRRAWFALRELPQYGVGSFAGNDAVLFLVPDFGIFGELRVAQRRAENLAEHVPLHLRLFEFFQAARSLQVRPFDQDGVSGDDAFFGQMETAGGFVQQTRQNQAIGFGLPRGAGRFLVEERDFGHAGDRCKPSLKGR